MLHFDKLINLTNNIQMLHEIFQENKLFLIGGAIRNLLLGIEEQPKDLDITGVGHPDMLRENIDKEKYSAFRTEKYGTITVIPEKWENKEKNKTQYELTPFRSEDDYTDNRHPDIIQRSDNLIDDSKRRDFSINSLYYTQIAYESENIPAENKENPDNETLIKYLEKDGVLFFSNLKLLIVSNPNIIEKLVNQGEVNPAIVQYLLNTTKTLHHYNDNKQNQQKKNNTATKFLPKKAPLQILIDPNHGLRDMLTRKIIAIGTAEKRFQEDALRIIRAIRFTSVLNQQLKNKSDNTKITLFDIDKTTRLAMKKKVSLVNNIAKERIKDEITKSFGKGSGFVFTALADELGLLPIIFPALHKTKHNDQPVRYHPFDTYAHTILTLYHLEKINTNYLVRLAMLYHDTGKPEQYAAYSSNPDKNEIRKILGWELNHRVSGPKIAKKEFWALGFSKKETQEIMRYIAEHHTPGEILMAREANRTKKLRKLYSDWGFERVNNLLDITIADRQGQYNPLQNSRDFSDVEELRNILVELKDKEGQFTSKDLAINGQDIMKEFTLPAGPQIWELLNKAFLRVANNIAERNQKKVILKYLQTLIK